MESDELNDLLVIWSLGHLVLIGQKVSLQYWGILIDTRFPGSRVRDRLEKMDGHISRDRKGWTVQYS